MEKGLINKALLELALQGGKDLVEVQRYLRMKYRIEAEILVLKKRLEKMRQDEKAVA